MIKTFVLCKLGTQGQIANLYLIRIPFSFIFPLGQEFLLLLHPKPSMIYFPTFGMFKEGEHRCNMYRKGNGWL